jgi:hypothetical protein
LPTSPGPKKETARIAMRPTSPAVEMKKTQPLVTAPPPAARTAPLTVAPPPMTRTTATESIVDEIPMSLCWTLLAASAVILIIQIWNYFI